MSNKVSLFLSHAVPDTPVTKSFVNLIESGIGVPPKNIFCTSNKGQGIRPGAEFKDSIRENLDEATVVIALISLNYYNSPFCMCELGGTWIQSKDFIPILIPPIRFSDMKAVLAGLQAIRIQIDEDLDELRDEIAERLGIKPLPTPRWNEKRDEFLKDLAKKLKKIAPSPVVQRELLEKANNTIKEYEETLISIKDENAKLKKMVSKLKNAKDTEQVSKIVRENMEEADVFEQLVEDVRKKISAFDSVAAEVFFVSQRGEDYYPGRESSRYTWDETTYAQEYKEIELNSEENGLKLNANNPKVRDALKSISELEDWLGHASTDFFDWYTEDNDGFEPALSDRGFWDRHLW